MVENEESKPTGEGSEEEIKKEEKEKKGEGSSQSEAPASKEKYSTIEEARNLVKEIKQIKEISDIFGKQIKEYKEMIAEEILRGRGLAGQGNKKETEDEKWAREAKVRYEGTGIDPT